MIYMLYMDGCPVCTHYRELIQVYNLESRFTPINITEVIFSEELIKTKGSMNINIPIFFTIDENDEKKVISRYILRDCIQQNGILI